MYNILVSQANLYAYLPYMCCGVGYLPNWTSY